MLINVFSVLAIMVSVMIFFVVLERKLNKKRNDVIKTKKDSIDTKKSDHKSDQVLV